MITISSMSLLSVQDKTVCGAQEFVGNGSVFSANVNQLVMNLSVEAPKFDGFSVGSVNNGNVTVYGLAQSGMVIYTRPAIPGPARPDLNGLDFTRPDKL